MSTAGTIARGPVPEYHNAAGHQLGLIEEVRDLFDRRHLLWNLLVRDLTVRYKRSVLGFFWTMLNPLLMMIVLTIVFSRFFRFAIEHYEIYFLAAYLPWMFFSQTTIVSMTSMAWNGPLMKRVRIPKSVFALAATLSGLVNLVLSCIPLAVIMIVTGAPLPMTAIVLPISFLILGAFTLGVSLMLSSIGVYFGDIKETYQVAVLGLMYLTPIFYPIAIIPKRFLWIVKLNPLFYLLEIVRDPIYYGRWPAPADLLIAVLWSGASLILGWAVFRRLAAGFFAHL